jgi:hypothetical protein
MTYTGDNMFSFADILDKRDFDNFSAKKDKYQATKHQQLAVDLAKDFNDMKNIGRYMWLCKRIPESRIRYVWSLTKDYKPNNRGAYFMRLINKN